MFKKISATTPVIALSVAVGLTIALSGCSVFYPHWGETTMPTPTKTASPSSSATSQPSPTQSATASATPSATPKHKAVLEVLSSEVDSETGLLTVVAQVINTAEGGGQCTLKFVSGSVSKTVSAAAEANVDTTQCFPLELNLADLPSGTAAISVSYDSAGFNGSTGSEAVLIP